jgi:RNA polymerase sigma factor (sigma-70 family)
MEPTAPGDSWRTWLMTGSRGTAADRRRVRGAHRSLKKLLIEGMANGGERPKPWTHFSGAMVRQAVNEALNELPPDHKQVVKLAYFGGLSNREIAQHLGLSEGGVQRRLRQAVARVSDFVEHGRTVGRRAVMGLLAWVAGRHVVQAIQRAPAIDIDHLIRTAAVLATGVVAASALAVQPAPPARPYVAAPHATTAVRSSATDTRVQPDAPPPAGSQRPILAPVPAAQAAVERSLQIKLPALHTPAIPPLPELP